MATLDLDSMCINTSRELCIGVVQLPIPTVECRGQRDQLPEVIRKLELDDQRLRNGVCWSVFDC